MMLNLTNQKIKENKGREIESKWSSKRKRKSHVYKIQEFKNLTSTKFPKKKINNNNKHILIFNHFLRVDI